VIGATNRANDLDPALRRPGRLDWELDFPLPTEADRAEILRVSALGIHVEPGLPHDLVAARTQSWSPAELTAIWTEASMLTAFDERTRINAGDYLGGLQARELERAARIARMSSRPDA
jgi:transitional endoplasmic reticulum ATPase